ncbi:hypothetical protein FN846DRAFT_886139 [Sphaerosporella brunnea]|uniref:Uncharacterized protein n=1 Tax=Sphaerosporella brunnea TaxID=1250544 RepID=A0A5J5FAC9_9PEZI|nr:hypothetical protein FN846DRAFT_886139 [Sphaerosporella brunnea]
MAALSPNLCEGRAPDADASAETTAVDVETAQAAGTYLSLPLYRALPDTQPIVPSAPTIPASDVKKRKRKHRPKRKPKMPSENDNPRKVSNLNSDTSACDRVCVSGPELAIDNGLAAAPEPASASAVQRTTMSIHVDVPDYNGIDIAGNLSPNGTVSAVTFSFGGSTS